MNLLIQDPNIPESISLHELLLNTSDGADYGAGVFAFVSVSGIQLLIEDEIFQRFLERGRFHLIIGVDEVTNTLVLERLSQIKSHFQNLDVNVFYNNSRASIFHPKFCWFVSQGEGIVVVGSGNLTQRGLRRNWEAFSFQKLAGEELSEVRANWNQWIDLNRNNLRTLEDPEVVEQARRNNLSYRRIHRVETESEYLDEVEDQDEIEMHPEEDLAAWIFEDEDIALIAEIPRASTRWNQANFDKHSFENYFGAVAGNNNLRILLRNVNSDSVLGRLEIRPSVSVRSRNFRFELTAAAGLDYPNIGRPIAIFIRVSQRMFLYTLSMPGSQYHEQLQTYLDNKRGDNSNLLRLQVPVSELKTISDNLPFWGIDF